MCLFISSIVAKRRSWFSSSLGTGKSRRRACPANTVVEVSLQCCCFYKYSRTSSEVWAGALSWYSFHELFSHNSGLLFVLLHANCVKLSGNTPYRPYHLVVRIRSGLYRYFVGSWFTRPSNSLIICSVFIALLAVSPKAVSTFPTCYYTLFCF